MRATKMNHEIDPELTDIQAATGLYTEDGRRATRHMRRYARFSYAAEAAFLLLFLLPFLGVALCVVGAIVSAVF